MTSYTRDLIPIVHPKTVVRIIFESLGKPRGLEKFLDGLRRSGKGSTGWKTLYKAYFAYSRGKPQEVILEILGYSNEKTAREQRRFKRETEDEHECFSLDKHVCIYCGNNPD